MNFQTGVASHLERARRELLDLTTRNRLLNVPRKSKTAKLVDVQDELSSEVFRLLVREGKNFTFLSGNESEIDADSADYDDPDFAPLPQPGDDEADARGIAKRHSDTRLQTALTSKALQKRLLSMFYDARTAQEEMGVNILFLAMGFLRWYEDEKTETERWAPLLLVPVSLERQSAADRFKLKVLPEDVAENLSLAAKLDAEFGLKLPPLPDQDDLDLETYFSAIAQSVAGMSRWEVLPNDMVLGFFSFSKLLMFRDLDAANWPDGSKIDLNATVAGLLRDGFDGVEDLIGEDEKIDPHIPPSQMVHVVDADSSQSLVIEEVRRGRHLVVQGPPGTGKSQTIANLVATAVASGKTVLFVAEKMAALDVVKRRLEAIGLDAPLLELHSHKANKREVLAELKRTKDLGRPVCAAHPAGVIDNLTAYRDQLNAHAELMMVKHQPSGLSAYQVVGHLVRLRDEGVPPPDFTLVKPETWTRNDKVAREGLVKELVERLPEIGRPADHPWRGVQRDAILAFDVDRLIPRIAALHDRLSEAEAARNRLATAVGTEVPDSFEGCSHLIHLAEALAGSPEMDSDAITHPNWRHRLEDIDDLLKAGVTHAELYHKFSPVLAEVAWTIDLTQTRQHLAAHGESLLRFLSSNYRGAIATFRSILSGSDPKDHRRRLEIVDGVIKAQGAAKILERDDPLGRESFGQKWRRERSDWAGLQSLLGWVKEVETKGFHEDLRGLRSRIAEPRTVAELAQELRRSLAGLPEELAALISELQLDLPEAFGVSGLGDLAFVSVIARLSVWRDSREDLQRWIAFRRKLDEAKATGLNALIERLIDGRLSGDVVPHFERAYYEAILRALAASYPDLARFDGDSHSQRVMDFRAADRARIELARLEVLEAHHRSLPSGNSGIGALGILNGEFAKKRAHLPIRKLMEKAGPAIQAIKPVFMMSPLSVAQFLPPGALTFDLLLMDEASQIMPVDALGAVARARQIVVVGDSRQLPPTNFFARTLGDVEEEDEDDDALDARNVESILDLCLAKGLPQRMLRWHYRSKHQSLIAVSNREFYDNKLFIVPSPYTAMAGMGLKFNHLPDAIYDKGNTRVNAMEAKAVAEAVVRHAKSQPELSLGVGTFSQAQKDAILNELELLRRLYPETEEFFNKGGAEPFFVKNLENIQGDERDVIFISVGYGRPKNGPAPSSFGPLSRDGGERRLNVLISRAKRRCEVFSSITDEDIDLERARSRGAAALKFFLHFARTGRIEMAQATDREMDSVFEEQVAQAIQAHGWHVVPQVGQSGFFIDLAIADPENPGRYILGIECDGATYHSSRSARDRDRLRQAVLEDHGWLIHRIWSTEWFNKPDTELRKVLAAIEAAKQTLDANDDLVQPAPAQAVPLQIVTWERDESQPMGLSEDALTAAFYQEADIAVPSKTEMHVLPVSSMAQLAEAVVAVEGPIHSDEVTTRLRSLWGLQRAGNRIQQAVLDALHRALVNKRLVVDGSFYSLSGQEVIVRDRSQANSPSLRKPEMLPPAELKVAVQQVVEAAFGASRDETIIGVARLLGFKATSSQLKALINQVIDELVKAEKLTEVGGVLSVPI